MKQLREININTLYAKFGALPLPLALVLIPFGLLWPTLEAMRMHIFLALSLIFWGWGILGLLIVIKKELPRPKRFGYVLVDLRRGNTEALPAYTGKWAVVVGAVVMVLFGGMALILCLLAI